MLRNCQDLQTVLQVGESNVFQPYQLYEKLQNMIPNLQNLKTTVKHPAPLYHRLKKKRMYPNICIFI